MSNISGGSGETQGISAQNKVQASPKVQRATLELFTRQAQDNLQARIVKHKAQQETQKSESEPRRITLKGEVTKQDKADPARYTVHTEDGDIILRTATPQQSRPAEGSPVTITIPLENRQLPTQSSANIAVEITPLPTQAPTTPELRIQTTPVNLDIHPAQEPAAATPNQSAPLPPIITAQISPLPAQESWTPLPQPEITQQSALPPLENTSLVPQQTLQRPTPPAAENTLSVPNALASPPLQQLPLDALTQNILPARGKALPKAISAFTADPLKIITQPAAASLITQAQTPPQTLNSQALPLAQHITAPTTTAHPNAAPITNQQSITRPMQDAPQHASIKLLETSSSVMLAPQSAQQNAPLTTSQQPALLNPMITAGERAAHWIGNSATTAELAPSIKGETTAETPSAPPHKNRPLLHIPHNNAAPPSFASAYAAPPQNTHIMQDSLFLLHAALPESLQNGTLIITPQSQIETSAAHTTPPLPEVPATMAALPILGPLLFNTQSWDSLNMLHKNLQQIAPQLATALTTLSPNASNIAQMMPAALFFISAIKGGDIQQWLGERTLSALKKAGKTGALDQFSKEASALSRLAKEPAGEWRSHALPFYNDGNFHKILLHSREDGGEQKADGKKQGKLTRFVFDLELPHIGPLQLDGLFHGKHMDVVLRTPSHFSQAMQAEMRHLYTQALGETEINGTLSFQTQKENWVTITQGTDKLLTENA